LKGVAVFPQNRSVNLIDLAEPHIQTDLQVKLRILEVGICGTDREICRFVYGVPPSGSDYFILGHECIAQVIEAGSAVADLSAGDLVVCMVRLACQHAECAACRSSNQDFCSTGDYIEHGIKGLHGFMTEYVIEERRYLHVVPQHLREVGVLVEPLTIAEKSILAARNIQSRLPWKRNNSTALVLGAGPVGLLGAMKLVSAGYKTYVYSLGLPGGERARIAQAIGATFISADDTPVEVAAAMSGSIDLVYEALGAEQVSLDVLNRLAPNGIYIFTGVPRDRDLHAIDPHGLISNLVWRNQAVVGVVNAGTEAFTLAVDDLSTFYAMWPDSVRGLITHRFPIERFAEALQARPGSIKNVIAIAESRPEMK
jgi:glucose 1-dehydrogenase